MNEYIGLHFTTLLEKEERGRRGRREETHTLFFPSSPFEVENPVVSVAKDVLADFLPRIPLFWIAHG
jgi:hypothetical protein